MLTRIISALVAAAVLIAVMQFDAIVITVCAVVLAVWCLTEAYSVFSYQKNPVFMTIGLIVCLGMPFYSRFSFPQLGGIGFILFLVMVLTMVARPKKVGFSDIANMSTITVLIPVSFALLMLLRQQPINGHHYVWLSCIGAFCTDTGAFFMGIALKGPKLCPELSPKKTISGSIGGFLGALIGFFVYAMILWFGYKISVNPVTYYPLALLCGLVAQLGDLTASSIKRSRNVKDFGNVLPGHGGFLDRVDSLMFVGPIVYIYVIIFGLQVIL